MESRPRRSWEWIPERIVGPWAFTLFASCPPGSKLLFTYTMENASFKRKARWEVETRSHISQADLKLSEHPIMILNVSATCLYLPNVGHVPPGPTYAIPGTEPRVFACWARTLPNELHLQLSVYCISMPLYRENHFTNWYPRDLFHYCQAAM